MRYLIALCSAPVLLSSSLAFSQDELATPANLSSTSSELQDLSSKLLSVLEDLTTIQSAVKTHDAGSLNAALRPWLTGDDSGLRFLKDANFELVTFEADGNTGLGFSYNYDKTKRKRDRTSGNTTSGVDLEFKSGGKIAFERELNPENLVDTRVALRYFRSSGGVTPGIAERDRDRLDALELELSTLTSEQLREHDGLDEIDRIHRAWFTNQLYLDVSLHAGLESNQSFSQKHWSYGLETAIVYRAYDIDSWQADANLLDYLVDGVRYLTAYPTNELTNIAGTTIPSVLLGIDQVQPDGEDPRADLGDSSAFARMRAEVAYRTPVARVAGRDVHLEANYRYWRELGASSSVEAADLDQFDHVRLTLFSESGVFLSYTSGMLPFDVNDSQTYQLGWQFSLN